MAMTDVSDLLSGARRTEGTCRQCLPSDRNGEGSTFLFTLPAV
ncbi:MAG: hypothetical protein ABFC89_12400 [Methanospirillum sp.]